MNVNWLNITDSTNNEAFNNREKEKDMTVWAAGFQTDGRGRRGNKWESNAGENLNFSILFKPENIDANTQFLISEISAIGVAEYLGEKEVQAKVKWPNDIYVGDRKICGMLIENILNNDKLAVSVSGIGLNINQRMFPSDIPNPTSLVLESDKIGKEIAARYDVKEELPKVLEKIFSLYKNIDGGKSIAKLNEKYESMLYRFGEYHYYEETGYYEAGRIGRIYGKITGIDCKTARLCIELKDGRLRKYSFNELKYII